ncbi:hypothetical protein Mgra_00007298, partial [Meloidogyne graminicola]
VNFIDNSSNIKQILFEEAFDEGYRYGINICLYLGSNKGKLLLTIRPIFPASIDWYNSPTNLYNLTNTANKYVHRYVNLNKIYSIISKEIASNINELIKISCYLNTEEFQINEEKLLAYDEGSSSQQNFHFAYLRFCIKFEHKGNYLILINGKKSKHLVFFEKINELNEPICIH